MFRKNSPSRISGIRVSEIKRMRELLAQRMSSGRERKKEETREEERREEERELGGERACRRAVYKFARSRWTMGYSPIMVN